MRFQGFWNDTSNKQANVRINRLDLKISEVSEADHILLSQNRILKCDVTKIKFMKLWDWHHFRIERPYKKVLAINYLLIVIPS